MDEVLLDVQALSHRFRLTRHVYIQAIDQVSFTIRKGGKDVTALYPYATASGVLTVTPKAVTITTGSGRTLP